MYGANQTLKHKVTNELIALSDDSGSNWAWNLSGAINEKGELIPININDYEPILDWFENPMLGTIGNKGMPDVLLRKYIVSDEVRKDISNIEMDKYAELNLEQMRQGYGVSCYARSSKFKKYFLGKFILYKIFDEFESLHKGKTEGKDVSIINLLPIYHTPIIFEFNNKIWSLKEYMANDIHLTTITLEKFEYMKAIMEIINIEKI